VQNTILAYLLLVEQIRVCCFDSESVPLIKYLSKFCKHILEIDILDDFFVKRIITYFVFV